MNYKKLQESAQAEGIEKLIVGAVLINNNQVLMLKRVADDFLGGLVELPGGTVEAGETLGTALCREIKEETNLFIKASDIKAYLGSFDYESSKGKKARQFNFLVPVHDVVPLKLSSEHETFHWVDVREVAASQLPISDSTKKILSAAENILFPPQED